VQHLKYQGEKGFLLLRVLAISDQFSLHILECSFYNQSIAWVLHARFNERLALISDHEHKDSTLKDVNLITGYGY
jgi:hypothetical protein